MITRRQLVGSGAALGAGLLVRGPVGVRAGSWSILSEMPLLDAAAHPKFVSPLPRPAVIDGRGGGKLKLEMGELVQSLGLFDSGGRPLHTRVWGYEGSYPGPTIHARRDRPLEIQWKNKLPRTHLLPVDTSLHWANPDRWPQSGIPTVAHLHGGHTESASDGLPEAWYTSGYTERGPGFIKKLYRYDNDQPGATLWYHDHALGITRLNVYAGLAGFYLLTDDLEDDLVAGYVLPARTYEHEIVIQDRMFAADGALYYPSEPEEPGAPDPSVLAEFFGDFIVVNGVAWPYLDVEPRKYRFRLLNGSDSRFYQLRLDGGLPIVQIGTDGGLLAQAVPIGELVLGPGERADIVVDFSGASGSFVLRNLAPDDPFRGVGVGDPADPATTGQIMRFNVALPLAPAPDATVVAGSALGSVPPLPVAGVPIRELALFEGEDQYGRLRPQLGIYRPGDPLDGSLLWDEEITETPALNSVERWDIYNATEDAHPIHLHLVTFQLVNREPFTGSAPIVGVDPLEGGTRQRLIVDALSGMVRPPAPNERGWKDTATMLPGEVTRLVAHFDRPGRYVWHCHILSHEDHEMMRPFYVT